MSRHNLPRQLSSFIGREQDSAALQRLLTTLSLVTLIGVGGSGKTRLALHVVEQLLDQFEGGVWLVELVGLTDPALVLPNVAAALEIREQPGRSLTETLVDHLRPRRLLLVLDNCEHVVAACAELAQTLLDACPHLVILATSQIALNLPSETVWPVSPLSVPSAVLGGRRAESDVFSGQPDPALSSQPSALLASEAGRLFVERAQAAAPGFQVTASNAEAVAGICRQLDGIPLALELAAARVKALSVEQIRARLADRFALLTSGSRVAPLRHQTLRAAVDWSYSLLTVAERVLLRRLSVFAGSFTLEAAEEVAGAREQVTEVQDLALSSVTCHLSPTEVLPLLTSLVDKSLVVTKTAEGEARYWLLETLRHYGQTRLREAGETEATQQQHAAFYLALAERADPQLRGPNQAVWLNRLETEHDNLRVALRWAIQHRAMDMSLRLANAVALFWERRGYYSEGRRWLDEILTATSATQSLYRGRVLARAGTLAWRQSDYAAARDVFEAALAIYRGLGESNGVADVLNNLGLIAEHHADYPLARQLYDECLALRRTLGDRVATANILNNLGSLAANQADFETARAFHMESLALRREHGDQWGIAMSLHNLGNITRHMGAYAEADAMTAEGLAIRRSIGDRYGIASTLNLRATIFAEQGDYATALPMFREALTRRRDLGEKRGMAISLEYLGLVASSLRQFTIAAHLYGAAEALREAIRSPMTPASREEYERGVAPIRAALNQVDFDHAWALGRALSVEQAVDLALRLEAVEFESVAGPTATATATSPVISVAPAPRLRALALGSPEVYRDNHLMTTSDWIVAKARELFFYLLCHPAGSRDQIGLALWPDASPSQVRDNCRTTVMRLRRALGDAEWIVFEETLYAFNRQLPYTFDLEAFETGLSSHSSHTSLSSLLALYRGHFLAGVNGGPWIERKRAEVRQTYSNAALRYGQWLLDTGRPTDAADVYRQLLAHDHLQEAGHRGLMRCLARQGDRDGALTHYATLVARLHDELHATPAPETRLLYETLKRGEAK